MYEYKVHFVKWEICLAIQESIRVLKLLLELVLGTENEYDRENRTTCDSNVTGPNLK